MLTLKSICVAQVSFELIATLLPQLHEYWDMKSQFSTVLLAKTEVAWLSYTLHGTMHWSGVLHL